MPKCLITIPLSELYRSLFESDELLLAEVEMCSLAQRACGLVYAMLLRLPEVGTPAITWRY